MTNHDHIEHDHCHHHHHDCDHINHDRGACECDDQLPAISNVGRGIKGDGFLVRISDPDDCTQTYLEGLSYDEATKEWHSEWLSENINGGELSYQYNLRPFTVPQTFTITFIYRRPGRCEWSWTSPAIPYIWSVDEDGNKTEANKIVGSGVATIFVRASKSEAWDVKKHERLIYPPGTKREDFNAPLPGQPWSACITFGHGGDIELPSFEDIAKILGVSTGDIYNILEGNTFTLDGITATDFRDWILKHLHKDLGFEAAGSNHGWNNKFGGEATVKDYIDKWVDHFHKDLGFPNAQDKNHSDHDAFGGEDNVKDYIDKKVKDCMDNCKKRMDELEKKIDDALKDIKDSATSNVRTMTVKKEYSLKIESAGATGGSGTVLGYEWYFEVPVAPTGLGDNDKILLASVTSLGEGNPYSGANHVLHVSKIEYYGQIISVHVSSDGDDTLPEVAREPQTMTVELLVATVNDGSTSEGQTKQVTITKEVPASLEIASSTTGMRPLEVVMSLPNPKNSEKILFASATTSTNDYHASKVEYYKNAIVVTLDRDNDSVVHPDNRRFTVTAQCQVSY